MEVGGPWAPFSRSGLERPFSPFTASGRTSVRCQKPRSDVAPRPLSGHFCAVPPNTNPHTLSRRFCAVPAHRFDSCPSSWPTVLRAPHPICRRPRVSPHWDRSHLSFLVPASTEAQLTFHMQVSSDAQFRASAANPQSPRLHTAPTLRPHCTHTAPTQCPLSARLSTCSSPPEP